MRIDDDYPYGYAGNQQKRLERLIAREYRRAWREMAEKTDAYFEEFKERDQKYLEGLLNGSIQPPPNKTIEEHYGEWRVAQIGRGQRMEELRDQMAERMHQANLVAASYINDTTPGIASLSHNFSCYQIEQGLNWTTDVYAGASFSLVHEEAIRNLMYGANQYEFKVGDGAGDYTFRRNIVDAQQDYEWNSSRIQTALTQGLLQGESNKQIAKRFYDIMGSNHKAAVRNARTSVTSALNAGTMQAYKEASDMGIEILVEWMSTEDGKTRDSHRYLDGVRVKHGKKFPNGLRYPGDPQGIPAEVYNCRCTTVGVIPGINDKDYKQKNTEASYKRWLREKKEKEQMNNVSGW